MAEILYPVRRHPDRFSDPPCSKCQRGEVRAIKRTTTSVYYRCFACNCIWSEPKPFHVTVIRNGFRRRSTDRC